MLLFEFSLDQITIGKVSVVKIAQFTLQDFFTAVGLHQSKFAYKCGLGSF